MLLIFTACNSKSLITKPTALPQTASPVPAASTALTPTPSRLVATPLSLPELYQARLKAGDWTEGQGLVNLLGLFTGSTTAQAVLGNYTVSDFELTGPLRLADQYLAANPTGPMHDEIQKQVNLLVAPLPQLERFSRKVSLSAVSIQLDSLSRYSQSGSPLGDQAECQSLWADGFTSTTPVICFEYAEQIVNGTSIRLYFPAWWTADDPNRARLAPILQAAALATRTFNAYGPTPLPPTTLVVTELAGTDPDTRRRNADLLALAVPVGTASMNCYVGVFPSLFTKTVEQSQQALAHEMFHCYQYQNLSAQVNGPLRSATEWWVEGSAEYFSNVVYPAVNFEYRWLGDITSEMVGNTSLFDWSYKAFIFFQYLENRPGSGTPGVLALLRALPTSPGSGVDRQTAAMSAYPNMDTIFHGFAEAAADQNIIDTDHSPIPLEIPYGDEVDEVTPGDIFGPDPFSVDIRLVVFPQNFNYDLLTTITGLPGQVSARLEDGPKVWAPMPSQVVNSCAESHYIVVVTQTGSNPLNTYEVLLRATSFPGTSLCSCLTGRWLMDNASYLTHLNGLIAQSAPGTVNYTDVQGEVLLEFMSGGQLTQQINALTISADVTSPGVAAQQLVMIMDGTTSSGFVDSSGTLSWSNLHSQLTLSTILNGQSLGNSVPTDYLSGGPLGTGASYTCSDNDLTLTPIYPHYTDLPPLSFTRQQP
jgi:hypothetical protein